MHRLHSLHWLVLVAVLVAVGGAQAQTNNSEGATVSSAPDPRVLLAQSLARGGGSAAIEKVGDFIAHGTITYYSSPTQTKVGQVTIRGRGDGQFRIDSFFADGDASVIVNNGNGQSIDANRRVHDIPSYNAMNFGWFTLPYMRLATVLKEQGVELSYVGLRSTGGVSFHQVRVVRHSAASDPKGLFARLRTADYYLNANDLTIVGIMDKTHPDRGVGVNINGEIVTRDIDRAVYYSDFRTVDGALVPFHIDEFVAQQQVLSIQLADIAFNAGQTDADFKLQ